MLSFTLKYDKHRDQIVQIAWHHDPCGSDENNGPLSFLFDEPLLTERVAQEAFPAIDARGVGRVCFGEPYNR